MNEIIPIKKDIIFKTKIGAITNISLDHDYKIESDVVNGTVSLSGTYKMTEASVIEEEFYYTIPFMISISKEIKKDTINIVIDDFKYDIDKDVLKVNIDLNLTCEKEKSIITQNIDEDDGLDNYINNYFDNNDVINLEDNEINNDIDNDNITLNNNIETLKETNINTDIDIDSIIDNSKEINLNTNINTSVNNTKETNDIQQNIDNITNNIINGDNQYYTYKVYIVRKGDTVDYICNKYNVDIDELKKYNNLNEINVGDKIIIPQCNE